MSEVRTDPVEGTGRANSGTEISDRVVETISTFTSSVSDPATAGFLECFHGTLTKEEVYSRVYI